MNVGYQPGGNRAANYQVYLPSGQDQPRMSALTSCLPKCCLWAALDLPNSNIGFQESTT